MNRLLIVILTALLMVACADTDEKLRERATELCAYIPDHELLEKSKDYMTADFYAVLDTMFNHLPEFEAMDHEWLYYFVTGNGGTIADYEVKGVELTDKTHAVATISVRQKWEDGTFDESTDVEEHQLSMEKVDGEWMIADFDGHKEDCIRHIALNRKEQTVRQAISNYLAKEIGEHYAHDEGDICVPTLTMVHEEDEMFMGDFWVYWYRQVGDTLKCVSGGNHAGMMTLKKDDSHWAVTSFEQTADGAGNLASSRRIFGDYHDVYEGIHSNERIREEVRKSQLRYYVKEHGLNVKFYQDYGWPAVEL
ncbi:MAG: hypothetical protein IJQ60_13975 [Prevotella sp.]|nr:hypothetical protein [Prevotella sp.]MBR0264975.1 hypothetical protein [Prevotella sp.]